MMKQAKNDPLHDSIVIWVTRVSAAHDSLALLESCLDLHEHERAARFRFPEDRARFVLGRGLLRKCLRRHRPELPSAIELGYTSLGRPILAQDETIQFSISHTQDLVAIALTAGARVGIDLEYVQPDLDPLELAARIFSDHDLRTFHALPDPEKRAAFFRAWTRKEAYLKARGEGIAEGLQQVSVSLGPEITTSLTDTRNEADTPSWRLYALPVSADYRGSLACDDAEKPLDFHLVQLIQGEVVFNPAAL